MRRCLNYFKSISSLVLVVVMVISSSLPLAMVAEADVYSANPTDNETNLSRISL